MYKEREICISQNCPSSKKVNKEMAYCIHTICPYRKTYKVKATSTEEAIKIVRKHLDILKKMG